MLLWLVEDAAQVVAGGDEVVVEEELAAESILTGQSETSTGWTRRSEWKTPQLSGKRLPSIVRSVMGGQRG